MAAKDPYTDPDSQADATIQAMISRLEERGQHPAFLRMIRDYASTLSQDRPLTVLDLGCGTGDGLEFIAGTPREESGTAGEGPPLVADDLLAEYVGLDINEDLLTQARECHARNARASFLQADLSEGLPSEILEDHEPFDLYFSSYAMLSHFVDSQCEKILADVSRHARSRDCSRYRR